MPTLRGLSRVSLRPESARQLSDERLFTLLANRLRGLGLCVAKRSLCGVVMVLALLSLSSQVRAQAFPSKPIRLVLPYPAGGGIDLVARPLAEKLTEIFGQSVVVDNRGGASGLLAMQQVASAAPDGYTIVLALNTQLAVNPSLFASLPYDPIKDFEPIVLIGSAPYLLVTNPKLEVKTLDEVIALARKRPGKLSYASSGNGSGAHLSMEMVKSMTNIDVVHVPYKSTATSVHDLMAGEVQMVFVTIGTVKGFVAAGTVRPIAVSGTRRVKALADVPTVAEAGLSGFESVVWYAVLAPAGTPSEIIQILNQAINRVLEDASFQSRLANESVEITGGTPEHLRQYAKSEMLKWAKVIKESGAKLD